MFNKSPGIYLKSDDGTKIWAESTGDPSKPTVVFIHGFTQTALVFEKQFEDERLLRNLHLVRYDLRGHGRSDAPRTAEYYGSSRHAQDFRAVCEGLRVKKPVVAGWSIGGIIPVDVASEYGASYMLGIIYLGSSPYRNIYSRVASSFTLQLALKLSTLDSSLLADAAVEFASSFVADPDAVPYGIMASWIGAIIMQPPIVRVHLSQRSQDERRFLEEGGKMLPVLAIQGIEDKHLDGPESISIIREMFHDVETHLLKGVGHCPCYERAEEVGEMILRFVNRITM